MLHTHYARICRVQASSGSGGLSASASRTSSSSARTTKEKPGGPSFVVPIATVAPAPPHERRDGLDNQGEDGGILAGLPELQGEVRGEASPDDVDPFSRELLRQDDVGAVPEGLDLDVEGEEFDHRIYVYIGRRDKPSPADIAPWSGTFYAAARLPAAVKDKGEPRARVLREVEKAWADDLHFRGGGSLLGMSPGPPAS